MPELRLPNPGSDGTDASQESLCLDETVVVVYTLGVDTHKTSAARKEGGSHPKIYRGMTEMHSGFERC